MTNTAYDSNTTADEVVAGKNLENRVVIVTGANTGIGFETARALASAGARVIFACRSEHTGQKAVQAVRTQYPECSAEFVALDLSSANSIQTFVEALQADKIDILICNAGLVANGFHTTQEGLESTVGVSHYGHFLLTKLLMPRLLAAEKARVVMVSSSSHGSPKTLNFSKFPLSESSFKQMLAYGQAKLANILMANELQRRYSDQGISACSLHPGTLITTDIGRNSRLISVFMKLISPLTKNPNQGAATTIYCALADSDTVAGKYFANCKATKMSEEAASLPTAKRLWEISDTWCDSLQ